MSCAYPNQSAGAHHYGVYGDSNRGTAAIRTANIVAEWYPAP